MKALFCLAAGTVAGAMCARGAEMKVSASRMAADNVTGVLVATGKVEATMEPFALRSSGVSKVGSVYSFGDGTVVTTCTNAPGHECWCLEGSVRIDMTEGDSEVVARDVWLKLFGMPVAWSPYWWQPLNTDYGVRVMPGYTSRWGAYLLSKYVYRLAGTMEEGDWGLAGGTRLDLRSKNGVALGQSIRWNLADFGKGKFKVYHAWDEDADRYDRRWNTKRHYGNWGSTVPDERYALMFEHRMSPTERDTIRARASYFSDSHFKSDFLKDGLFGLGNRYPDAARNELAYEHRELAFAMGAGVSGPLNDFYGGTARLPEIWFDAMPQPLFSLPVNYESSTRLGWLERDYALHGRKSTTLPYRYDPGVWANYQAFRADTYHRLTLPFRVADVVSVVPRAGLRGTWWSDSGVETLDGTRHARSMDDDVLRTIVEGGATLSARGVAKCVPWLDSSAEHVIEPYLDFIVQEAQYSGLRKGARPYIFDSIDSSADWLDQFAGRSRNLPYSYFGITPGWRTAYRMASKGGMRTFFDFDVYAAVQFNDTSWTGGGRYHRLARDPENPNYGRDGKPVVNPGARARWFISDTSSLRARAEWDGENDTLSYADVSYAHTLSKDLKSEISWNSRDHRWWDYSSTPFDPELERNEDFNWAKFSYARVAFEHEICDAIAWGPYVSWDLRENELDEIGTWLDFRTDCLGFRFCVSYENGYKRIDWSERDDDWRVSFGVYLRAFGPSAGTMFGD
ncbi:MAG: hypothetical protein K6F50_00320 [Kiritimatiellae bacterium]|nr:hypothetical protein [Kiritimatiellia bacterium]